ncbi:glycosyltransferase family 4 protein [Algoriphagus aestuariicola]|uniref:Glycosyltransferase family 4 protein n=2 Tax=Algoriphagus aestuariicola TaxID=1852016 RepID=A0ABS3BMA6_9BACT|nr:glycosyltransferase family 4 protein [Algoriphagus aestuariicola]
MGASSRLRTYQYLDLWKEAGFGTMVSPFFNEAYLKQVYSHQKPALWNVLQCYFRRFFVLFSAFRYDFIWVEKELFPFLPAWGERFLRAAGLRLLLDYDDAVFHNYDQSPRPLVRALLSNKIDQAMRAAACVFVGNEYLAERARKAGAQRISFLRTVVDQEKYSWSPRQQEAPVAKAGIVRGAEDDSLPRQKDLPTIGWIGSPSTLKYLSLMSKALADVYQKVPFRFVLVNSETAKYRNLLHLPEGVVEHLVWSEDEEVSQLHRMDIGIMPLPDDPWERGKCAYKLIQYMACGLPVVASPVGMNKELVCHGRNGFLAQSDKDWEESLLQLLENPEIRQAMGKEGKGLIARDYTLTGNFQRIKKELEELEFLIPGDQ